MARNLSQDPPPIAERARHAQAPHQQAQQPQATHQQAQHPQAQHLQTPHPQARHPLGLDAGAWPTIRQSSARLSHNQDAFIRQLHYDVTTLIPDLTDTTTLDMWVFCERIAQSLLWVALTDQPLGVVAETLRQVGAQNWLDGFPDSQYITVAHALVQTVHYLSEHDWSASTGSAWITYFMWIKPHLLAGAQQAAAQYAAEREAAEREAAGAKARFRGRRGRQEQEAGDLNAEPVASLLDEDDEDVGYGQIMVSMTRPRRDPRRRTSLTPETRLAA
jgi:hypothetical protein